MSLRKQLLAFGLLTLVLPWTGYRFVQEMEAALRSGLERALLASAATVAAALDDDESLEAAQPAAAHAAGPAAEAIDSARGATDSVRPALDGASAIYAETLGLEPRIDGLLDDDWSRADPSGSALESAESGTRYWTGVLGRYLYVYLETEDRDVVYQGPPGEPPYGDRVVLALEPHSGSVYWLLLATGAPGVFRAQATEPPLFQSAGAYEDRVLSAWHETAGGFAVEARVPLSLVGAALGIARIDVDSGPSGYAVAVAKTWDLSGPPGPLIRARPDLEAVIAQFGQTGSRFRVLDKRGWMLAASGSVAPASDSAAALRAGPFDGLFEALLRRDDPAYSALEPRPGRISGAPVDAALAGHPGAAWYRDGPGGSAVVAAAAPILRDGAVEGAVLLEQASDPILTVTNRALVRLMTFTLLAASVAAIGLLGFATLLSFRVRRLARAAETALGPKGEIEAALPGRASGDEIGDLARSFGRLLERLREHTSYLKTLAGKLSHELRTPLAVVSTSLDNLEQEVESPAARPYLERLRDGAARLDAILAAMSEATRMEQAVGDTVPEVFDLAAVVDACSKAYADIYTERRFACRIHAAGRADVLGSAELTAQLMDKLVDNAVGFSPPGSLVEIELAENGADVRLSVANRGPRLPEGMRRRLFDSLVSMRSRDDGQPHLGLGLHIVALIAEFHGGRAEADDLPDGSGVVFSVTYPRAGR
ncbi:MAG TPA: ATP-binding protein [Gammaproteobacteria bacterium]|nr:ATP-binding protein [Gammaproteobacteria bacterium]